MAEWTAGDFTADGVVDRLDFIEWNNNKFQSSDGVTEIALPRSSSVPGEIGDTRRNQVTHDTGAEASSLSPQIAAPVAQRVDAIFGTSRRAEGPKDERPTANLFENFGDDLPLIDS